MHAVDPKRGRPFPHFGVFHKRLVLVDFRVRCAEEIGCRIERVPLILGCLGFDLFSTMIACGLVG